MEGKRIVYYGYYIVLPFSNLFARIVIGIKRSYRTDYKILWLIATNISSNQKLFSNEYAGCVFCS